MLLLSEAQENFKDLTENVDVSANALVCHVVERSVVPTDLWMGPATTLNGSFFL